MLPQPCFQTRVSTGTPSTAIILLSLERGQVTTGASQVRRPPPHVSMRGLPDVKRGHPEVMHLCCHNPASRPECLSKGPSLYGHRHQSVLFIPSLVVALVWAPSRFSMRGHPGVKRLCCHQLAPRSGCYCFGSGFGFCSLTSASASAFVLARAPNSAHHTPHHSLTWKSWVLHRWHRVVTWVVALCPAVFRAIRHRYAHSTV